MTFRKARAVLSGCSRSDVWIWIARSAPMASPVRMGNPKAAEIPKNFVGGGESGFDSVSERARQAGWGIYPVDSGHDTMITHAPELADILLEIGSE